MDRQYIPEDLYEQGWRFCNYSDKWHFNDDMQLVGRDISVGLWRRDEELGVLKGYADGSDMEETIRRAVENAS